MGPNRGRVQGMVRACKCYQASISSVCTHLSSSDSSSSSPAQRQAAWGKCVHLPSSHQTIQHAVAWQKHKHAIWHNLAHRGYTLAHAILEGGGVCVLVGGLQHCSICPVADGPCPDLLPDVNYMRGFQLDRKGCAQLQGQHWQCLHSIKEKLQQASCR